MPSGGYRIGAGRPGRHLKVEDCRRLDVRELQRAGVLSAPWRGGWEWRDAQSKELNAAIGLNTSHSWLRISYSINDVFIADHVPLARTACALGGERPWFRCPGCDRRVALLLLRGQRFRCRTCQDVAYRVQSEDAIGRAWRAQVKLEGRLLENWRKPKGMHRTTRAKITDAIIQLEMKREDILLDQLSRYFASGWVE